MTCCQNFSTSSQMKLGLLKNFSTVFRIFTCLPSCCKLIFCTFFGMCLNGSLLSLLTPFNVANAVIAPYKSIIRKFLFRFILKNIIYFYFKMSTIVLIFSLLFQLLELFDFCLLLFLLLINLCTLLFDFQMIMLFNFFLIVHYELFRTFLQLFLE